MIRHPAPRVLLVLAANVATLFGASASAQATWSATAPTKDHHCGDIVPSQHAKMVWFQSCVLVHDGPGGAYVQGAVKVTNTTDNPKHLARPKGYTRVLLENKFYRSDYCGSTTIAGGETSWCYGKTTLIAGHNRDVFAIGFVWAGEGTRDHVESPHWKIAPTTPTPPGLPAAWSNGPVNAPSWHPAMRSDSRIACKDTRIPTNLPPQSVSRGWTPRTLAIIAIIRGPAFGWTKTTGPADGTQSGHINGSYHYCGRAVDAFAPGAVGGTPVAGAVLSKSWRLANWAAHNAAALNVSQVIFYDRIWTAKGGGWRPYTNNSKNGADRDTLQHRDHVHISVY